MSVYGQAGRDTDRLASVNDSRSQKTAQRDPLGLRRRRYLTVLVIGVVCCVTRPMAAAEDMSAVFPPNTFLRIATIEVEPYVMVESEPTAPTMTSDFPARRPTNQNASSPDDVIAQRRYVGYIPDLLRALAALLVFRYELYPVPDASYGYRKASREWSGLIGELVSEKADMAASPMLITDARQRVVDFTSPFMTTRATLLLRRPPPGAELTVKDLAELVTQSEIKYGTLRKGFISRNFRSTNDTLLTIVWRNMRRFGPSALTSTNEEGIEKVRREKFGFVLPDTIGDYLANRKPCDLVAVGRFLDRRGYAVALQKSSRYTELVDRAIRHLRKTGYLDRLKAQWWDGRGECGRSGSGARISRMYGSVYISSAQSSRIRRIQRLTVCYLVASLPLIVVASLRH